MRIHHLRVHQMVYLVDQLKYGGNREAACTAVSHHYTIRVTVPFRSDVCLTCQTTYVAQDRLDGSLGLYVVTQ